MALADLPVTIVAATAGGTFLEHYPDNVYLADFLPGAEVARRADLVICNGGTTSVHQALAAGVPFLGIIYNMDQWMWAKTAQRSGAGTVLREREASAKRVQARVRTMLAGKAYRRAAQRIARAFRGMDVAQNITALMDEITLLR